jgi:glycosyltransferase involved in cell wall biosynthesis
MKKISVVVPTFNEEENVIPISEAIIHELEAFTERYAYELIFIDNDSHDSTRDKLRHLCHHNGNIKAIFNAKNFGQFNSPYYGICQATGDAVILMVADFQDPVELIPKMIKGWEDGYKIVSMIKIKSKENPIVFTMRSMYYKLIKKMSDVEQIEHFTGFGLYDKSFIQVLRDLDDPKPFLRGIVAELGFKRLNIPYTQAKRRNGKTSNNWYRLYDAAMLSFTSYTKIGLRIATIFGFFVSFFSVIIALAYLILKLIYWDRFPAGNAPILIGMFVLGGIQLFFIGLLGEYILNMNDRIMKRPLVVEEERLNFTEDKMREAVGGNIVEWRGL